MQAAPLLHRKVCFLQEAASDLDVACWVHLISRYRACVQGRCVDRQWWVAGTACCVDS